MICSKSWKKSHSCGDLMNEGFMYEVSLLKQPRSAICSTMNLFFYPGRSRKSLEVLIRGMKRSEL